MIDSVQATVFRIRDSYRVQLVETTLLGLGDVGGILSADNLSS